MNVCVSEMAGGEVKNASANWEQRMLSLSFDPVFFLSYVLSFLHKTLSFIFTQQCAHTQGLTFSVLKVLL